MDKQNIEQLLRESGGIIRLQGREYVTFSWLALRCPRGRAREH